VSRLDEVNGVFRRAARHAGMTTIEDERATPAALERPLKPEIERWPDHQGCGYYPQ
jgi:hypothetical protein